MRPRLAAIWSRARAHRQRRFLPARV